MKATWEFDTRLLLTVMRGDGYTLEEIYLSDNIPGDVGLRSILRYLGDKGLEMRASPDSGLSLALD